MEMIGRIRRMHARGKKSEREISRATGLSRNTVAKWLHEPVEGAPKYQRERRATKLTPYHEALTQALKVDAHRVKRERRTARALHAEGRRASALRPAVATVARFVRNYVLRRGFLDGGTGLTVCRIDAWGAGLKYARLRRLQ